MKKNPTDRLLQWCTQRIGTKEAMSIRFSELLPYFQHLITFSIIKIAGTNGKGSTSAMLASVLQAESKKVGLFTSPHLVHLSERFSVNSKTITSDELERIAAKIEAVLHQFVAEKGVAFTPSFFEVLILIGLQHFHNQKVEFAILEAGVGGSRDATSLLPNLVSVITTIGKDHIDQLGGTLKAIARNKAGIAKPNSDLLIGASIDESLTEVISKVAVSRKVNPIKLSTSIQPLSDGCFNYNLLGKEIILQLNLKGTFQADNLNTVVGCWKYLHEKTMVQDYSALQAVATTQWPGRFERIENWLIDAAHNEHAIRALIHALNEDSDTSERVLLFGLSKTKDRTAILPLLPQIAQEIYLTDQFYNATDISEIESIVTAKEYHIAKEDLEITLQSIQNQHPNKQLIATGSIFLIGAVRALLHIPKTKFD